MAFGKKSKQQKESERLSLESAQKQAQLASEANALARDRFSSQKQALDPVQNFWSTLLSGDRQAMLSLLAPELATLTGAAEGARRSQAALSPRGGSRVAANANINDALSRDFNSLVFGARPQAAGQMFNLGSLYGGEGINLTGLSGSNFAQSGQGALNLAQFLNSQRGNFLGALGSLAGTVAGSFLGPVGASLGGKLGGLIGGGGKKPTTGGWTGFGI